jgi:hypothetical protein
MLPRFVTGWFPSSFCSNQYLRITFVRRLVDRSFGRIFHSSQKACWTIGRFRKASVSTLRLIIFIYSSWSISTYSVYLYSVIGAPDNTQTHDPTPLDEGSSRSRDLSTLQHSPIRLAGFEPAIPASERQQAQPLDRAATRIGWLIVISLYYEQCNASKCITQGDETLLPNWQKESW